MLYLISLLSFLLPTQLGLHLYSPQSTVYGFQIDYLISTIYLTDIVAMVLIAVWLYGYRSRSRFAFKFNKRYIVYCILYIAFAATNILYSIYYIPALYRWIKITEMILLGIVIFNTKRFDVFQNFIKPLSYSIAVACILGIFQYINKGSIGSVFYWFGERNFLFSDPNIAPYPYSFFSHPNSFAGFLLVFGIFLLEFKSKFKTNHFWTLAMLVTINLILTNSLNVYITILILLFLKFRPNLSFSFLAFDFSQRFITHRVELIKSALTTVKENFWFGVGLNNFIPNLVKVSNTFVNSWELQPVHNIFLLVFSEVGVIGFAAFVVLLFSGVQLYPIPYTLYAILASGQMDHYWLTLQQNMLLFTFVVVISKKKI